MQQAIINSILMMVIAFPIAYMILGFAGVL
jgi:hypothetical protein